MIISVRRWLSRLRFLILFLALTYFLIHVVALFSDWITPVNKYRAPQGKAVKVFHQGPIIDMEHDSFTDRLKLFFWYGE